MALLETLQQELGGKTREQLWWMIDALRRSLKENLERADAAQYRAEVAEWAVTGVVMSRVSVTTTVGGHTITPEVAKQIGRNAAQYLLHEAKLAFTEHAKFNVLLHHTLYLEQHLRDNGIRYVEWSLKDKDKQYTGSPSYISGAFRPRPFGSPMEVA